MLRLVGHQRRRHRYLVTTSICLIIYAMIVVVLHLQLSQSVLSASGSLSDSDDTLSGGSADDNINVYYDVVPSNDYRNSRFSSIGGGGTDAGSFLRPPVERRLAVAFPAVCGCPVIHSPPSNNATSTSSSLPPAADSDFQPLGVDFLYTAYVDDRLQPIGPAYIRVLALLRRRSDGEAPPRFYARLIGPPVNGSTNAAPLVDAAELYEMCENHGQLYGGWIVSWRLSSSAAAAATTDATAYWNTACRVEVIGASGDIEDSVSLPLFKMRWRRHCPQQQASNETDRRGHASSATADNEGVTEDSRSRSNDDAESLLRDDRLDFAVCVPPLFGDISAATLVQFVELSRLLGANHVVFYVVEHQWRAEPPYTEWISPSSTGRPVSEVVRQVLDRYATLGLVTTVKWQLPAAVADSIWYGGQLIAVNDCLYRTSHAFRYVVFNDLDEFIVPRGTAFGDDDTPSLIVSWKQMIEDLRRRTRTPSIDRESEFPSSFLASVFWRRLLRPVKRLLPLPSLDNRSTTSGSVSPSMMPPLSAVTSSTSFPATIINGAPCGYSFQSAFFSPVAWKPRLSRHVSDYIPSYDLSLSTRRSQFSRVRTKVMVRPEAVFEVGIHHVSRPLLTLPEVYVPSSLPPSEPSTQSEPSFGNSAGGLPRSAFAAPPRDDAFRLGTEVVSVPPDVGLVHHYRQCLIKFDANMDCSGAAFVRDEGLRRTGHIPALEARVRRVLDEFLQQQQPRSAGSR